MPMRANPCSILPVTKPLVARMSAYGLSLPTWEIFKLSTCLRHSLSSNLGPSAFGLCLAASTRLEPIKRYGSRSTRISEGDRAAPYDDDDGGSASVASAADDEAAKTTGSWKKSM